MGISWDQYFFDMIDLVKKKSKDPSTKVGCVITGPNHEVISTGFNGLPIGVDDKYSPERYERPHKYLWAEHAERNAIYLAARRGVPLEGGTIYVNFYPCADCSRGIIQSGIKNVVVNELSEEMNDFDLLNRWEEQINVSLNMLHEAMVKIKHFGKEKK